MSRNVLLAAVGTLIMTTPGCLSQQPRIPADARKPLEADFDEENTQIVEGRYLLLPVGAPESEHREYAIFSSIGAVISKAAWSGLASGYPRGRWLNLEVVDLEGSTHHTAFDRQVALGDWRRSFESSKGDLVFENLLVLTARTTDTNDDKNIDEKDAALVYTYDLATSELKGIVPSGYRVAEVEVRSDRLVLVLADLAAPHPFAVYTYDPRAQQGRFVVEGLTP